MYSWELRPACRSMLLYVVFSSSDIAYDHYQSPLVQSLIEHHLSSHRHARQPRWLSADCVVMVDSFDPWNVSIWGIVNDGGCVARGVHARIQPWTAEMESVKLDYSIDTHYNFAKGFPQRRCLAILSWLSFNVFLTQNIAYFFYFVPCDSAAFYCLLLTATLATPSQSTYRPVAQR